MNFTHEILNVIHSTPESRISLAQKLQVTRPYITKLTAALLNKGVIEETEQKDSPVGRPRTILAVKKSMFFSVNVMVRQYTLEAMLNDYNTTEKTSATAMFTFNGPVSPDAFAAKVNELINLLCQHAGVARQKVIHTGVALQGGIEQFTGVVRWCPALNEQHVRLKDRLLSACNTGVSVVNIAWCSCYMLNKALMLKESWLAFCRGSAAWDSVILLTGIRYWVITGFILKLCISLIAAGWKMPSLLIRYFLRSQRPEPWTPFFSLSDARLRSIILNRCCWLASFLMKRPTG
ncbi:hypothetical protein HAT91_01534 [Dickeya solani]|nr:hypothetical protein HAT91_01534 [Dickeya solani]